MARAVDVIRARGSSSNSVELTDDNRATIYGALLDVAARLRGDERNQALMLWHRRGKRAF